MLKIKKQKSIYRIISLTVISFVSIIILYFLFLFAAFSFYKNDLSRALLLSVNQKISGEISFSDISFTPFRHFPDATINLSNLKLKESKDSIYNLDKNEIININEAYASLNLIDLFNSKINVTEITIEDGSINLIMYQDGKTNINNAIKKYEVKKPPIRSDIKDQSTPSVKEQTSTKKPRVDLNLNIDDLQLINVNVKVGNHINNNRITLFLNNFEADFYYANKKLITSMNLETRIDSLILGNKTIFTNKNIKLKSDFDLDLKTSFLKVIDGRCEFEDAKFLIAGTFDSQDNGNIDLAIKGSDEDLSFFSILLSSEGMKNLESGKFNFNSTIKGKIVNEFPVIDASLAFKDVFLINPITKRKIKNFNFEGRFNSGEISDFSNAILKIDNLKAEFPDGKLKFAGSINNFVQPEFDADLFLKADVTGLDKVFKLDFITDLKGKIEINDRFKGKFIKSENRFDSEINTGKISLENFGLNIPGAIKFDKVDGVISRKNDDYYLDSLSIISDDTDLFINGEIKNLQYLFFNIEKDINANLTIRSSVFDLPNFLAFDPSIKKDFNYRIIDVYLDVLAKTTTSKALKFKSFPEIDFDLKKLDATLENFLPRLKINSGNFKISESLLGFNMKFDKFITDFLGGNFNFTAEYNTSKYEHFYIKAKTDFKEIYLSKLFYSEKDTVPESMKGKLSGSFLTDLQFPIDSILLKFIRIKNANMIYEFSKDTIVTQNLNIDLNKIYFNEKIDPNPFATLFTNGRLKANIIKSNSFNFKDINFDINVINGRYEIKSDVVRLFGENAKGSANLTVIPFAETPSYKIIYNDVSFRAEKMLSAFNEDQVINGPLKLSFNISSTGSKWDSIVSNMNGTIKLSGDNLLLNGFDADEIIDNFKRSQNFNLVDLGAVLLAGPVGIAVTKGSDFARILVFNSGKSTNIIELVSNWTVSKGIFKIQDAAFTTNTNRIALTGFIGFSNQNLDLTIALLDRNGCSIFSQQVYGSLDAPTMGKVKVVGTVLAPVTNLVDDVTGKDCDVFYDGSVEHPQIKSKNN